MTGRNGRNGWLTGAVLLLLLVCALVVPVPSMAFSLSPVPPLAAAASEPCHHDAVPSFGAPAFPVADLTAADGGGAGDPARHHSGGCTVAVCPLSHAALVPVGPFAPSLRFVRLAAPPFVPLRRGIGVIPPLPPPRLSV